MHKCIEVNITAKAAISAACSCETSLGSDGEAQNAQKLDHGNCREMKQMPRAQEITSSVRAMNRWIRSLDTIERGQATCSLRARNFVVLEVRLLRIYVYSYHSIRTN